MLRPALGLCVVVMLSACSSDDDIESKTVDRDDYGLEWPFSVSEGVLSCEPGNVVTFTANGHSYRIASDEPSDGTGLHKILEPPSRLQRILDDGTTLC